MAFKIASEYDGIRAMIASEPATHEFLRLRPDNTARINPETGLLECRAHVNAEPAKVRAGSLRMLLSFGSARSRRRFIPGAGSRRIAGNIPRVLRPAEAGKDAWWETYDHDDHGFIYVKRNDRGEYQPDMLQIRAVNNTISFFDRYLKGA